VLALATAAWRNGSRRGRCGEARRLQQTARARRRQRLL